MTRNIFGNSVVVVVHGVGSQVRGDTALSMARSLAAIVARDCGACAFGIRREQEEFVDCDDASKTPSFWIPTVDITKQGETVARVHEFYWADMSQYQRGWLIHILSFLRLVVALPRLALFGARGARVYKVVVFACWSLMVLRTIVIMISQWLGDTMGLSALQITQSILVVDIPLNVCFLFSAIGILVAKKRLLKKGINGLVGLVSIAASYLTLQSIPYAFFPMDIGTSVGQTASDGFLDRAEELYAPNTLVGIWPYLEYSVLWLWAIVVLVAWGIVVKRAQRQSRQEKVRKAVAVLSTHTALIVKVFVFTSLVCLPTLFIVELLFQIFGSHDPLFGLFDEGANPVVANLVRILVRGAIWPAAFLSGGLILSGEFRDAISPILELTMDVEHYLLHSWQSQTQNAIEGGRSRATLRETLSGRLHALIGHLLAQSDGHVIVVAHSLGSVIAFDALSRQGLQHRRIHLITMGSPLMKLAWAYPGLYGDRRRWANVRGEVNSWRNLYGAADVVGRDLMMASDDKFTFTTNEPIGCSGHMEYFDDAFVAETVVAEATQTISPESSQ